MIDGDVRLQLATAEYRSYLAAYIFSTHLGHNMI